jgi:phosphoribosylformylglycinamidine synthase
MTFTFVVHIERKPGLSDPEGATTARALADLGFTGVSDVTFGRTITIAVAARHQDEATRDVEAMCSRLLANPVIETFTIEAVS